MPSQYLTRAAPAQAPVAGALPEAPDPQIAAVLTVATPILAILIGWGLLNAIAIGNSTAYSISYSGVRTAITQALDKDLATDRVQDVLTQLPDPTPGTDEKTKTARTAERTTKLKTVATRLNGSRARLADVLTTRALTPHPGLDQTVRASAAADPPRARMTAIVSARLNDDAIKADVKKWSKDSFDAFTLAATINAVGTADAAADAVAGSVGTDGLRRTAVEVVGLKFDSYDTRAGETAWATDVTARLTWAIVALVFSLTFVLVVFATGVQISRIGGSARGPFIVVTLVVAILGALLAYFTIGPTAGSTPLARALQDYSALFDVRILSWTALFNLLRAVGVVLLVAGSVATFWVEVKTKDELTEQLRGFKSLFNSGAIFLMAGVLEVYAAYRWPVIFAPDDATRVALQTAAATFAAAIGALCSVVLLATYVATTIILRQQAIAHGVAVGDANDAFNTLGFGDLTSQQGLRLTQALLPLLPGVITVLM